MTDRIQAREGLAERAAYRVREVADRLGPGR